MELRITSLSARSSLAVVCAITLASILISPSVPSPPTLMGKAIHVPLAPQALAVLPPSAAGVMFGPLYQTFERLAGASDFDPGPVPLPLRR
ncbi:MAG TPA: hypothetical protein VMS96_09060 [Terriglobales bacterium]|nr:hypothetical protein [Terriglobales bacterium]